MLKTTHTVTHRKARENNGLTWVSWVRWSGKWCGQEAAVTYALRQLKFPSSNINMLDNPVAVSTGTFVIHSVIHQCYTCWLKIPPVPIVTSRLLKRGLKGRLLVVYPAQNINEALSLKLDKPLAGLGLGETPSVYEAGRFSAFCFRFFFWVESPAFIKEWEPVVISNLDTYKINENRLPSLASKHN